tara:strand:- start:9403 stop:10071 length:669 start_codon:yes stop_codon:yes gene_type:complete
MDNFSKYVFKMVNVNRFLGKKLDCPYSIGEHSYRVACLSMAIVDAYNKENKEKINLEEVLRKALIHDMEETITGDVPSPVKKLGNMREELRKVSYIIMEKILSSSPLPDLYLKMWKEDKDGKTGEVISYADKLEGLLVCYYELKRGNRYLEKPFISHVEWFASEDNLNNAKKYSEVIKELEPVYLYLKENKEYKAVKEFVQSEKYKNMENYFENRSLSQEVA